MSRDDRMFSIISGFNPSAYKEGNIVPIVLSADTRYPGSYKYELYDK